MCNNDIWMYSTFVILFIYLLYMFYTSSTNWYCDLNFLVLLCHDNKNFLCYSVLWLVLLWVVCLKH